MTDQSAWDRAARQLHDDMTQMAPKMAASMTPAPGTVKVSPEHERAMYWQRAITPEEEQMAWQAIIQEGLSEGLDEVGAIERARPRVAMSVYPARVPLIRQGERALSVKKQIQYAQKMEKLGPPTNDDSE